MKAKGNPVDLFGGDRKVTPWTRAKGNPVDPKLHCYTIGKSQNVVVGDRAQEGREEGGNPPLLGTPLRRFFSLVVQSAPPVCARDIQTAALQLQSLVIQGFPYQLPSGQLMLGNNRVSK